MVAPPPFSSIMTAEAVREGRRRSGADQQDGDAEGDSQHQLQVVLHPFHALVDAVLQDRRHHTGQRGEGHTGGVLTVVSPWSKPRRWSSPAAWPGSGTSQGWGPSRTDRSGDHNTSAGGEKKSVRADQPVSEASTRGSCGSSRPPGGAAVPPAGWALRFLPSSRGSCTCTSRCRFSRSCFTLSGFEDRGTNFCSRFSFTQSSTCTHTHTHQSGDLPVTPARPGHFLLYLTRANGSHDARRQQEDEDEEEADEKLTEESKASGLGDRKVYGGPEILGIKG